MIPARPRIAVVVLGDVGRSPRMQYHALALANRMADVELIGLAGSEPLPELLAHPHVRLTLLPDHRASMAARAARQAIGLWRALRDAPALDAILIQNPPAIPSLAVALVVARRRRARLIVDWHNLTAAMLALRLGSGHPAVRMAAGCEHGLGRRADAHLCVSRAMQDALAMQGIAATVLHDRPAARFAALHGGERAAARRDLCTRAAFDADDHTPLVISATSWSADEDFDLLLEAVARCEEDATALRIVITGQGPRRAAFEARMARLPNRHVRLATLWLSPDEYPRLLAAADLGLCLHRSASGLDLPMKIADMLGAGLPVLALDYGPCLREMILPGETALLFSNAEQLAERLREVCAGTTVLDNLRTTVAAHVSERWEDAWDADARPLFEAMLRSGGTTDEH